MQPGSLEGEPAADGQQLQSLRNLTLGVYILSRPHQKPMPV